jgi:hypothetical protein
MQASRLLRFGIIGGVVLATGVVFVSFAEGQDMLPSRFDKAVSLAKAILSPEYIKQLGRRAGECDQSATTTDCSKIVHTPPPPPVDGGKSDISFGPLKNIYTDSKYGFSLKYPDEVFVVDGGDIALEHRLGGKNFFLKICNPTSLCGSVYSTAAPRSLQDFGKEHVLQYKGESGSSEYKEIPKASITITAPDGGSILKQTYQVVAHDKNGRDITAEECEMCNGNHVRYVLYRNASNYFILIPGEFNDPVLEKQIINSITY